MKARNKAHPVPFSFDHYDDVIGFVVSQAAYQLARTLSKAIEELGFDITPREFAVINRLHQHGQLNQSELAEMTYKDKPAVTRMLDRLIDKGFIKKHPSAEDRRMFNVALTKAGESVRSKIVPLCVEMLETSCEGISHDDLLTTVATLKRLTAQIQ